MAQRDEPHRCVNYELRMKPGACAMFNITDDPDAEPWLTGRSDDGAWRCDFRFALYDDGSFAAYQLSIEPWSEKDAHPLGTAVLSSIPLHRWTMHAHAAIAARLRKEGSVQATELEGAQVAKPGPKGFGAAFYRDLALEYLRLQEAGVGRGIRPALATWMEGRLGREVDDENAKFALTKATRLGFLTPGQQGRAGRLPGPNLYTTSGTERRKGGAARASRVRPPPRRRRR